MGGSSNLERTLTVEVRGFDKDKGDFLDLGHPLLNRIAESFVKAACIRAIHAVSRDAYFAAVDSTDSSNSPRSTPSGAKSHPFPRLKGETNSKSLEVMVKNTGKETLQWGLAAGIYSGLTYGLKEARGAHDWVSSVSLLYVLFCQGSFLMEFGLFSNHHIIRWDLTLGSEQNVSLQNADIHRPPLFTPQGVM
ncbi:hypothetical protein SLEP1_g40065 [Rubroshorea leprosula]|uniref:Uncharacterized protein n=1 Tax=Rubroshorea leprosula TaxID=152421 RepID=A0AAV5L2L5_9ROSI|nr:hypothetical protein SLEP1_g40065 [Rubroshorea leprosula]